MLTMRSQDSSETADPAGAEPALAMGEAVALAFDEGGGKLGGMGRDALACDLSEILEPLRATCTNAEWIEAVNARLDRLEGGADTLGPRLERFGPNGSAEMTTPSR